MLQTKSCRENINIDFVLSDSPPESRSVSEIMWKKKHGMRRCVSPVRIFTRTRHSVMLYVHCLSCVLSSSCKNMSLISDVLITSGNFLRDLGELSELNLLIDD